MPQTNSRRRRRRPRPGKVAVRLTRMVGERNRLLAIRAEITAAFEADVAELRAAWAEQVARIDTQLRGLDRGFMPQPLRDEDDDPPDANGRTATQLSGGNPC